MKARTLTRTRTRTGFGKVWYAILFLCIMWLMAVLKLKLYSCCQFDLLHDTSICFVVFFGTVKGWKAAKRRIRRCLYSKQVIH